MTPEQIETWAREANAYADARLSPSFREHDSWKKFRDTEFARLVAADAWERAAAICDEMQEHYAGYKDTALLNGDVELSNAASGEPRACEFLATTFRAKATE